MKQWTPLVGLVTVAALLFTVGLAGASTSAEHDIFSHTWKSITFLGGLERCPLVGTPSQSGNVLRDVDLTDQITSTYTPYRQPLYQINSIGSVHGAIHAPDGTYTVAGAGLLEHRIGDLAPRYFSGSGYATVFGPAGSVSGKVIFKDLLDFPPQEFDLIFTKVTSCHLNRRSSAAPEWHSAG